MAVRSGRLPVRWRLSLWYAALLAVSMALFGGTLYLVMRQELYAGFDEQLLNQAALTLASVRVEGDVPTFEAATAGAIDGEYFLRLLGGDGRVVFETSDTRHEVPLDGDAVAAALGGRAAYSDALDEDRETLRLVSVPVPQGDGGAVAGVLQVGLDRNEIEEPLARFLHSLLLAGPLVLALAAAGGYLLAGRALAPVAAMTRLATRISASDLRARLNLDLPDDELGRLARTFDAMLARIEDAFERQRRFTGDAAHELRTPLSLMRSQVDLALARPRSATEYREALQDLDGDLERMTDLVAALLVLARADAGRLAPNRAPCDLAATVAAVREQDAARATEAGVTLRADCPETPLAADEDLLVQLLVNLVDNALAHTPAGGDVTIGCRGDGDLVRVWVEDSGAGIAPEHLSRLFDRFYRIDRGRSRARGGTGLGLAICKAIVEAHGGTIALTSEVGRGTRVEAALPRAPRLS